MSDAQKEFIWGLGRRKSSVARVRLAPGTGQVLVNKRPLKEYFPVERRQRDVLNPLNLAKAADRYDVFINVRGGGDTGQAGACVLGIARALIKAEPEAERLIRPYGLLTRDSRMVERKKYGLRGARRGCQFSKR
ncbi:MAG: 30S ribosomal protein S9 [Planctomycetota bacterium]